MFFGVFFLYYVKKNTIALAYKVADITSMSSTIFRLVEISLSTFLEIRIFSLFSLTSREIVRDVTAKFATRNSLYRRL